MVSVLAPSTVDRGFEHRLGQTKDKKKGICCFSANHAALKRTTGWLGIRIIATGPCIANQLRDVNIICRSWYIAAHIWKIYDFKIEQFKMDTRLMSL